MSYLRTLCGISLVLSVFLLQHIASPAFAKDTNCQQFSVPVTLSASDPTIYHVATWLCAQGSLQNKTIQFLVSGLSYDHFYWDWPMQPETYSYVQTITAAGYAVLNLDRIGIGQSDHPPALDVTITSNAWVVHQLIGDLRQGSIGDVAFSKVILVGHSLGSQVSLLEASTYADVDGVILTGLLHVFFPTGLATVTSSFYPVQLDPNFATSGLPEGYITTRPGTRGADFYHTADADSAVIALDETLKQTGTDGESTDSADTLLPSVSQKIHVPVLLAVGQYDSLFCNGLTLACNNQSDILARESTDYAPQACLEAYVLSQSGHDLNLHLNANEWFAAAVDWANRRIGESATNPATQPCE